MPDDLAHDEPPGVVRPLTFRSRDVADRVIRPTHTCFDDALEFLGQRVTLEPALAHGRTLRLVHGVVVALVDVGGGLRAGEPFAHAWLEEIVAGELEPRIWQTGVLDGERVIFCMTLPQFRRQLTVLASTAYSPREIYHENRRSGHYGPWRADYRAFCRGAAAAQTEV